MTWTLQAPYLPEGTRKDFRLAGRITYQYATSSIFNIPVYTKNEAKTRALDSVTSAHSKGPLRVEITGPPQIIVNTDPGLSSSELVVYNVKITNTGEGIPITGNKNGLLLGTIRFAGGIAPASCLSTGQEIFLPPIASSSQAYDTSTYQITLAENDLVLRDGKSASFSCTLGLDRRQWTSRPFGTAVMSFDLNYIYFIEEEATVSVRGIRL
jgi:hypothetical protein